jgi:hypothetical protein
VGDRSGNGISEIGASSEQGQGGRTVVFMWNRRAVRCACVRNLVQLCQRTAMQAVVDTAVVPIGFFARNDLQLHMDEGAESCQVSYRCASLSRYGHLIRLAVLRRTASKNFYYRTFL